MEVYCGLDYYSGHELKEILSKKAVAGVVLGDLFCQRRMFDFGEAGFMEAVGRVHEAGRQIVYQPPLYATPDVFSSICDTLGYLDSLGPGIVLVQDIGLAERIAAEYKKLTPVWNRMGRSREYTFSGEYLRFLKDVGLKGFETDDPRVADLAERSDLTPWLVYGNLYYRTMGRTCYIKYQLNCGDSQCPALCRRSELRMQLEDDPSYRMTVDGYMLGEQLRYSEGIPAAARPGRKVVLYARNLVEWEERYHAFRDAAIQEIQS